ncbi:hypothetical protein, partial [Streptomyces olivaceus]
AAQEYGINARLAETGTEGYLITGSTTSAKGGRECDDRPRRAATGSLAVREGGARAVVPVSQETGQGASSIHEVLERVC